MFNKVTVSSTNGYEHDTFFLNEKSASELKLKHFNKQCIIDTQLNKITLSDKEKKRKSKGRPFESNHNEDSGEVGNTAEVPTITMSEP